MEEIKDRKGYLKATDVEGVAILEGTAEWCTKCKAIAPFVDKVRINFPSSPLNQTKHSNKYF